MAAIIADLDGTVFDFGTQAFLPGSKEELKRFHDLGNQIIFVTQRAPYNWLEPLAMTERVLKSNFPGCAVIFGISSPRILINDAGAVAINHPRNDAWHYDLSQIASQVEQ